MTEPTVSSYALLGLLQLRPWTSYELTGQVRRSLRFAWPRSDAHLYVEQKRLVRLGWARAKKESVGRRSRTHYEITAAGSAALRRWLATEPSPPRFEIEGLLRLLFAEHGSVEDLRASLEATARFARAALDDGLDQAREYLATGGPFPERLHLIALASEWFADSLGLLEEFCRRTAETISAWDHPSGPDDFTDARRRLEAVLDRHAAGQAGRAVAPT